MSGSITDRMGKALSDLDKRWSGRRRPKAFYLTAADWREFIATKPSTIQTMFGNNPPRMVTDPAFHEIPVRESKGRESRLYDNTTTGRAV